MIKVRGCGGVVRGDTLFEPLQVKNLNWAYALEFYGLF
jgi:hypothetical protein